MSAWPLVVEPFFSRLYSSHLESRVEKSVRLRVLKDACSAARLDRAQPILPLPLFVVLDVRLKMKHNKDRGSDNLVAEMFSLLEWPALEIIRIAFGNRLNAVKGHCELVPKWDNILVQCIPKRLAAHFMTYCPCLGLRQMVPILPRLPPAGPLLPSHVLPLWL
eukprot:8294354-Heterocapsa_arctica.AAC.2